MKAVGDKVKGSAQKVKDSVAASSPRNKKESVGLELNLLKEQEGTENDHEMQTIDLEKGEQQTTDVKNPLSQGGSPSTEPKSSTNETEVLITEPWWGKYNNKGDLRCCNCFSKYQFWIMCIGFQQLVHIFPHGDRDPSPRSE
jgi:hypothetical protein